MEDLKDLERDLLIVKNKLNLLSKQKQTPDRIDEAANLEYEKDQLEYEIQKEKVDLGLIKAPKIKKGPEKKNPAKTVRSIKKLIRI